MTFDRVLRGRRWLLSFERFEHTHEGGLFFSWRAWNWRGHFGTQCRLLRYKFTFVSEIPKENS